MSDNDNDSLLVFGKSERSVSSEFFVLFFFFHRKCLLREKEVCVLKCDVPVSLVVRPSVLMHV